MSIKTFGFSLSQRLKAAGIKDHFTRALDRGSSQDMSRILKRLDYTEESANAMVKTFLKNPKSFSE